MQLINKSDEEIQHYSSQVLGQLIKAGNNKNWAAFSAFFIAEGQSMEAQKDVESQWENNPVLTTFIDNPAFLGTLRKGEQIVTLWKMRSSATEDDILGFLAFVETNNEIKVSGFRVS